MGAQIITTPAGEELALLPRAEYDALLARAGEDAGEADGADAIARRVAADIAAGREAHIPEDVWEQLERSDRRLRVLRRWRKLTQLQLATRSGVAQPNISVAENTGVVGVRIGRKLARALGVPLDVLLGDEDVTIEPKIWPLKESTLRKMRNTGCDFARLVREDRHMTVADLSDRAGVPIASIQRLEAGNPISNIELVMMARTLGVDVAMLQDHTGRVLLQAEDRDNGR